MTPPHPVGVVPPVAVGRLERSAGSPERDQQQVSTHATASQTRLRRLRRAAVVTAAVLIVAAGAALATTVLPGGAQDRRKSQANTASPVSSSGAGPYSSDGAVQPAPSQATSTQTPSATINAVTQSTGSIAPPEDGAKVKNCAYFSGTSQLAKGKTLILAMRNLDYDTNTRFVEQVFGWDKPDQLSSWQGAQYFNGEPGQHYSVELMAVDLEAVRATPNRPASDALAKNGTVLAVRKVTGEAGTVGNNCPGPE